MTDEEIKVAITDGYRKWKNKMRWQAVRSMFIKKCVADDFDFECKWFYWFKSLVCLLLNRTNGSYLKGSAICYFNGRNSCGEYSGCDWEACWVEEGIFKNWRVCVITDSSY
jgi:hypothetical protein